MSLGCYSFIVTAEHDGEKVRNFLRRACGLSARSLTVLKHSGGRITVEDREQKTCDILHAGDIVTVELPQEHNDISPMAGNLDILFEDDYLLIVNKPASLTVHPVKIYQHNTLANLVVYYQRSRGEDYVFRAMNRLDRDTSGCVMIAKDRIAHSLVKPTVHKTYIAVCEGVITEDGAIDTPIALAPESKIKRCVSSDGQPAVTHYHPIRSGNGHTLCSVWLETGRTHQIRCHMSSIGHPLASDDLYGGSRRRLKRQALHCQSIEFIHPVTHEQIQLQTDIPPEFLSILEETE